MPGHHLRVAGAEVLHEEVLVGAVAAGPLEQPGRLGEGVVADVDALAALPADQLLPGGIERGDPSGGGVHVDLRRVAQGEGGVGGEGQREPHVLRVVDRAAHGVAPAVAQVEVAGALVAHHRQDEGGLAAVGDAVTGVPQSAPGAGDAAGGRVLLLVGGPAAGAGGQQEVHTVALEQGRGLAGLAVPQALHLRVDAGVVGGEAVDVQVAVLVGGGDHVAGAVVVDVGGDVPGHLPERAEAAAPGVVAVDGGGDRDGRPGLAVVGGAALFVHPHDELSGGGVVHHLGTLDVRAGQLRVGRLRQHVPAELPGLQVGRAVRGDVAEGVVGVAVLAEPVVVRTHLDHTAAVRVQRVARGVHELGPVGDRHGDRLGLPGALEQGGAQGQCGGADGRSQTQHVHFVLRSTTRPRADRGAADRPTGAADRAAAAAPTPPPGPGGDGDRSRARRGWGVAPTVAATARPVADVRANNRGDAEFQSAVRLCQGF